MHHTEPAPGTAQRSLALFAALVACLCLPADTRADSPDGKKSGVGELLPEGDSVDIESVSLDALLEVPLVEAATRREQSLFDTPSDVSLITHEDVHPTRANSIAELLRSVPGVFVQNVNPRAFSVGFRGVNTLGNPHVLVLVDGRNPWDPSLGNTNWGSIPLHPGEVERIEIVQGPGTTLYGANAMSGVISIRSKRPLDHPGTQASLNTGIYFLPSFDDGDPATGDNPQLNNGGSGYLAHAWANEAKTVGVRVSAGFNAIPNWESGSASISLPGQTATTTTEKWGVAQYHVFASGQWRPDDATELFATASHTLSDELSTLNSVTGRFVSSRTEQTGTLTGRRNFGDALSARFDFDTRATRLDAGDFTLRLYRNHALAEAAYSMERNHLIVGVEGSFERARNLGEVDADRIYGGVYVRDEFVALTDPRIVVSAGLRAEIIRSDGGTDEATYRNINPSLSVVWNQSDRFGAWATAATAYRTPTVFENFSAVTSANSDPSAPPALLFAPNPDLKPVQIRSLDGGFRFNLDQRLRGKVTGFVQNVDDAIFVAEPTIPLRFDNVDDVTQIGTTTAVEFSAGSDLRADVHYTFAKQVGTDRERFSWPEHIIGGSAQMALPAGLRLQSSIAIYSPIDPEVVITTPGLGVNRADTEWQPLWDAHVGKEFSNGLSAFIGARNIAGFFRDRDALRQSPVAAAETIGSSFLIGLSFTEPTE